MTIQGEGALAGLPTYFVRFGGCDYRCSWCDSLHAVLPKLVRENSEKLRSNDIIARIKALATGPEWVTLSGGNPALLELGELVQRLRHYGYRSAVETQGSKWKDWLADVDCLTVSPKPPSSGMATKQEAELDDFMCSMSLARIERRRDALKIVVFDEEDYQWARKVLGTWSTWPRFLSCGTVIGEPLEDTAARYRWLMERTAGDKAMQTTRVLPQLHVVGWGHKQGV